MQSIAPLALANFTTPVTVPLSKLEIYHSGSWQTPQAIIGEARDILKSVSTSMAGADPTLSIIAGSWSAVISNPNAIFHPLNPTTTYVGVFAIGKKVRISQGLRVGGNDYFWKVMCGIISKVKYSLADNSIAISGMDYSQALTDHVIGLGAVPEHEQWFGGYRLFTLAAGLEVVVNGGFDANTANWTASNCTLASVGGGQAGNCLEITHPIAWATAIVYPAGVKVTNDGTAYQCILTHTSGTADDEPGTGAVWTTYWAVVSSAAYDSQCAFQAVNCVIGGRYQASVYVKDGSILSSPFGLLVGETAGGSEVACYRGTTTTAWTKYTVYFVATAWVTYISLEKSWGSIGTILFDTASMSEVIKTRYPMDNVTTYPLEAVATGGFGMRIWSVGPLYDDYYENEDWVWNPAVPELIFNPDWEFLPVGSWLGRNCRAGVFEAHAPEEAVFYLLSKSGLYASYADAETDTIHVDTGITIPRISFPVGMTAFEAIRMIAERCNYKFYFRYDGKPVFIPKPALKAPGAEDLVLLKNQVTLPDYDKNDGELFNRVMIEGETQGHPISFENTDASPLKGTDSDAASIAAYGEKNLAIKNMLWQTQATIDAAATSFVAELHEPKGYLPFDLRYCPLPVDWGDTIKVEVRLTSGIHPDVRGIVRDIKVIDFSQSIILELAP